MICIDYPTILRNEISKFPDSFVGFPRPSYKVPNLGSDTDDCPEIPDKDSGEGNWVGDIMTIAAVVSNSSIYSDFVIN